MSCYSFFTDQTDDLSLTLSNVLKMSALFSPLGSFQIQIKFFKKVNILSYLTSIRFLIAKENNET